MPRISDEGVGRKQLERKRSSNKALARQVARLRTAHNRNERKAIGLARAPADLDPLAVAKVELSEASMNRLEMGFSVKLELDRKGGELAWWAYEPLSFRLGRGARYTPDFVVLHSLGALTAYEVKGNWEEAARVRIKVAAGLYTWMRFVAVKSSRSGWDYEEISP